MAFQKCSGGGGKSKAGIGHISSSSQTKVTLGFKPKYLAISGVYGSTNQNSLFLSTYDSDYDDSKAVHAGNGTYSTMYSLPNTTNYRIASIDDDGFTLNKSSSSYNNATFYYFAIG